MKIGVILGTRPEIIKLSALIRLARARRHRFFLVHTGQHFSYGMDKRFFKELGLPAPQYRVSRPERMNARQHTRHMTEAIERILQRERPTHVLVQGDTNSVRAGALAASKRNDTVLGHVEAGLRSYDPKMPEEANRIIADHASHLLFAPTAAAKKILLGEGIHRGKIFVTGNTIVDAVLQNLALARKSPVPAGLSRGGFFLMTLHRQENVDHRERLRSILKGLSLVTRKFRRPVFFPIHPRTALRLREFRLPLPEGVRTLPPAGFLPFLRMEASAGLILTDSGGIQEEACILRVPCVTLRTSTERPETVEVGANVVAGQSPERILAACGRMLKAPRRWKNPFGDGRASQQILRIILKGHRC